jgi:hypothetical protein
VNIPALTTRGYECRILNARDSREREGLADEVWMRILLNRREIPEFEQVASEQRSDWLLLRTTIKDSIRSWITRHRDGPVYPADIQVEVLPDAHIQASGMLFDDMPPPRISAWFDQGIAIAIGGPGATAVIALDGGCSTFAELLSLEEEEYIRGMPDSVHWKQRANTAKLLALKYWRVSAESSQSVKIITIDKEQGLVEVGRQRPVVNPPNVEDTLPIATACEDHLVVAVAFEDRRFESRRSRDVGTLDTRSGP